VSSIESRTSATSTALLAIPELGRVYALRHRYGRSGRNRLKRRCKVHRPTLPAGTYPDGLAYAPRPARCMCLTSMEGPTRCLTWARMRGVATVQIGVGVIANTQYDEVSAITCSSVRKAPTNSSRWIPKTDHHRATDSGAGCKENHGLLIDSVSRAAAFVACQGNDQLIVMDLRTGRGRLAQFPRLQRTPTFWPSTRSDRSCMWRGGVRPSQ